MKLIDKKHYVNGMSMELIDMSRKIAGDRWFVKLVCELSMPISDDFFVMHHDDGEELLQAFKKKLGGVLRYSIIKERIFIDEQDYQSVWDELFAQFDKIAHDYLSKDVFPARLLAREYEKFKLSYQSQPQIVPDDVEEDEGPADFSMCFKDIG